MRSRLALLTTAALIFSTAHVQAADFAIGFAPAHGLQASQSELEDAYKMATETPGLTSYSFSSSWENLNGPQQPDVAIIRNLAHFGGEKSLPASLELNLIDGTQRTLPKELSKSRWGTQQMLLQFDTLITNLVNITGGSAKWISLGNDADIYFSEHKSELDSFLSFYKQASGVLKRKYPSAKIGLTISYEGLTGDRKAIAEQLIAISDAVFITYYPQSDYAAKDMKDIEKDLTDLLAMPFGKQIVLANFGYPSDKKAKGSEKDQAEFYKKILPLLKGNANVDLVVLPPLHDTPTKICKAQLNTADIKGRDAEAFLCSLGFHDSDGKDKPSWKELKRVLQTSATAQPPAEPPAQ